MRKVVIVVLGVLLFVMFSDGNKNETKKVETPLIEDLGLTVEEFQVEYNQNALERNLPQMQLNNVEFGTGKSENTFYYKFVDTFYLFGKVNPKTGKIKSVNVVKALVLGGNDRKAEAQVAAMAFLIMVKTLSPALDSSERAAIINKFSAVSKISVSEVIGNIRYSQTLLEDGKVLMLSADIKD